MEGAPIKLEAISRGEFQNVIGLITETMRSMDGKMQCIAKDAKDMHESFDRMQQQLIPLLQDYQRREKGVEVVDERKWDVKLAVIAAGASVGGNIMTAGIMFALRLGG